VSANHFQSTTERRPITVSRDTMAWSNLDFDVWHLRPGDHVELDTDSRESAIVVISGAVRAQVSKSSFELSRPGVFDAAGGLLYVPPGADVRLEATAACTFAVGSAPAVGMYPVRLIRPGEVRVEVRGGGAARRQVNHLLAPPLPAERLIVYEVFVPAGSWAGWPPHRHDGQQGSPYLEETYYFRFDRPDGFGFHRNYTGEVAYDETLTVTDGDCVAVPRGFHVTTAAPGHNMWILNFLAGDLVADDRATPPYFDPSTTWITERWEDGRLDLPVTSSEARG
jgi:5-deoxy-glucuronate isomerase